MSVQRGWSLGARKVFHDVLAVRYQQLRDGKHYPAGDRTREELIHECAVIFAQIEELDNESDPRRPSPPSLKSLALAA